MKINKFYAAAIAAYVIWGFFPIALKSLSAFSSGQILYFRILTSAISLIIISFIFRKKKLIESIQYFKDTCGIEKRTFVLLNIGGGILLTVNWLTFIYVINHISINTGSFSYLVCPILTAILGAVLLKESLSKNQRIAILISALSCLILGWGSVSNLGFSLLIAFSYAFYIITQRILKIYDKIFLLMLQLIIAVIIIAPLYQYFNGEGSAILTVDFFYIIIIISLLFTVLPLFLSLYALKEMPSGTMGILMYINPVLNFIIAFLIYKEVTSAHEIVAYFFITISIILYNVNFSKVRLRKLSQVKNI